MEKVRRMKIKDENARRVLCLVMAFVFAFTAAGADSDKVQAAGKKQAALKAYKKKLRSASSKESFFVYDLNHDGVPELFLSSGADDAGQMCPKILYTYYRGKVKEIDSQLTFGSVIQYYPKGSVYLHLAMISGGYEHDSIKKIIQGKTKVVAEMKDDTGAVADNPKGPEYFIAGKKVTKAKYNKYIKKLTKNTTPKSLENNCHKVTKANIKKYVK